MKVLKFGGTSVGTIERIQHVANIIKGEVEAGNKIIAVVSAMAGKTNELVNFSKNIDDNFDKRELDVLLSSGEQVTCALLAGALLKLKIKANIDYRHRERVEFLKIFSVKFNSS